MSLMKWLTHDLRRGDLHALSNVARSYSSALDAGQIERLSSRGFIIYKDKSRKPKMTAKGWLALLVRRLVN